MKKLLSLLIVGCVALLFVGCASMSATKVPTADLGSLKSFYVVKLGPDERGINQVIADQLSLMGYQATTGAAATPPTPVDAVITYQDKWMWDITMYMIELNIQVRQPDNQMLFASGKSYRPSIQRKSPAKMAREVLESILNQK